MHRRKHQSVLHLGTEFEIPIAVGNGRGATRFVDHMNGRDVQRVGHQCPSNGFEVLSKTP